MDIRLSAVDFVGVCFHIAHPLSEKVFDPERDAPVAQHRYAVYKQEHAQKYREIYRAADGIEERQHTENNLEYRSYQKYPPVRQFESARGNRHRQFRNAFVNKPHCENEGQETCDDVFV